MHFSRVLVGLSITFLGPVLLIAVDGLVGKPDDVLTRIAGLLYLWVLAGSVVAIVVRWEKLPISSIGFHLNWRSIFWGLGLALVFQFLVAPLLYSMIQKMGTSGFETGLARLAPRPVLFLLFAALTGGVTEELLFRGYAIERLAWITGKYWLAGLISTTLAALLHLPMWGWGPVATFFISGGMMTIFYIFTRDLLACMIAHVIIDAAGIIAAHFAALAS
jgi:CAAX protease family protein